jgi:broad specificity phosphatase PhoE
VTKAIELRRHSDNDGDALTPEGVRAAVEIGARLTGGYTLGVTSGAQRATQTLACFLAGLGQPVPNGVVVEAGLRSEHEDRWRELYRQAGSSELATMRGVDPAFVDGEAGQLGQVLRRLIDVLDDGGRALAVGHSPTNEAAVYGLTGQIVPPLAKGAGVLVVRDAADFRVETLS